MGNASFCRRRRNVTIMYNKHIMYLLATANVRQVMIYSISKQKLNAADNLIIENTDIPTGTANKWALLSFERHIYKTYLVFVT